MTTTDVTGWTREQHADADALDQLDALATPDDPLSGLLDMIESGIVTARTVEDQLQEHSRGIVPSADTGAFDALIKGAYLDAQRDVAAATAKLLHAAQLVRGLAR